MLKKILIAAVIIVVVIQFIHPARNNNSVMAASDITKTVVVPDGVQEVLQKACYDCHSNHTVYPWYSKLQPVDWWLTHHINEGKEHLNFSEFGAYTKAKQSKRLHGIAKTIEEGEMPLDSYLWIHKNAILSAPEKKMVEDWAEGLSKQIAKGN